ARSPRKRRAPASCPDSTITGGRSGAGSLRGTDTFALREARPERGLREGLWHGSRRRAVSLRQPPVRSPPTVCAPDHVTFGRYRGVRGRRTARTRRERVSASTRLDLSSGFLSEVLPPGGRTRCPVASAPKTLAA